MSLETDFFFSEVPYFDEILDAQGAHSLNYDNRNQSMMTIQLTDKTQKKSNTGSIKNEDSKSEQRLFLDNSNIFSETNKNLGHSRMNLLKPKQHRSLLPELMNKKIKSSKMEITVYFFDTRKRIIFTKNQINKAFLGNNDWKNQPINNKQNPTLKMLIPYLVKCYCKLFLNFEPLEVDHQTFELKLANFQNKEDPLIDPISHDEEIMWLYEGQNYVLIRKERSKEKIIQWQNSLSRLGYNDVQALQILTPMKRKEMVEQFQRNKNVNSLKEKILSYNHLGKIVIVTYNSFKICEPKKKIGEIVSIDRVLQIYREKVNTFIDIEMYKKTKQSALEDIRPQKEEAIEKITNGSSQFEVSSNFIYGNLYLKIENTTMIQKYQGGIINFLKNRNQLKVQKSLYALTGLSVKNDRIKLKFMHKNGQSISTYRFDQPHCLQIFLKSILRVGRQLKQNFQKI